MMPPSTQLPDWFWSAAAITAVFVLAAIGWALWRLVRETHRSIVRSGQAAAAFGNQICASLNESLGLAPRILIDGRTHVEGSVPTLELVVLRRTVTRTVQWSSTRLGSTKRISAAATFTLRAGLDLRAPVQVNVDSSARNATAYFPVPKLLSVQVDAVQPAAEESGWWNRIRPEDRTQVQAALQEGAVQDVLQAGFLDEAEAEIRNLIQRSLASRPRSGELICVFDSNPQALGGREPRATS